MRVNLLKSLLTMGLLTVVVVFASGCPLPIGAVTFSDERLERAVRTELFLPFGFITQDDMRGLRRLDARNFGIRSLKGLEAARFLEWLDLGNDSATGDGIADLEPLRDLVSLAFLNITNNNVSDLVPIEGLCSLRQMILSGNNIFDLEPLVIKGETCGVSGGSILLSKEPLIDEDTGEISASAAQDIGRIEQRGVKVNFAPE